MIPRRQQQPQIGLEDAAAGNGGGDEGGLPQGWDVGKDYDGKVYFIDHNTKKTTWIDPRER
jgi:hypothetical protein